MDNPTCDRHLAAIARDGYTIIEAAIEPDLIEALGEALDRLEHDLAVKPSANAFEGARTVRIYNLLAHGAPFTAVPVHAKVLPIVEGVIGEGCLISSLSSIAIDAGETAQPIHADDQVIPLEKPHRPIICNSMWALTEFTETNGATRLVPASHLRPNPEYGGDYATVPAEMAKGSVLIWDGALWHGGGANRTGARRTGVAMNYCAGFIRQQENQQLGLAPDLVCGFEPRLRDLVGYGVYRGLYRPHRQEEPGSAPDGRGVASDRSGMEVSPKTGASSRRPPLRRPAKWPAMRKWRASVRRHSQRRNGESWRRGAGGPRREPLPGRVRHRPAPRQCRASTRRARG